MSLFGEYPCKNESVAPIYISFTTAAVCIPLCLFTVAGNLLVVLAIFTDPNKDLKSPFNYFVANLAISDLLVGFVVDPIAVVYHIMEGVERKLPPLPYIHMPYFISCTASVLSLAALTLDRYLAITSPLTYRTQLNPQRAGFVAAGIWVFSVSFPFIYLVTGYLTYSFVFLHTVVIATLLVILLTYHKILRVLKNQMKQWDLTDQSTADNQAKRKAASWEQKVTKTFIIILSLFLVCYLPSCICIYIINLCKVCSCTLIHWARDIPLLLILANSGVNPFVYAWRFENFRKAFAKLLRDRKCSRQESQITLAFDTITIQTMENCLKTVPSKRLPKDGTEST
ncbi:5-hydroxytryptamine receptor 1A-beta-like [Stylophora pistillata]|uniref:5-hydroxytryptamine receptor 1A-beta-like n=1 Tax=Stylophora pistillata TaxID=50429 RepID=UPI000C042B2D|nr:5-hydroxytryptamine receptor 1A-beta-like [Stylophora pistillata]